MADRAEPQIPTTDADALNGHALGRLGPAMSLAEFDSHVSRAGSDPKVSFRREDVERIRAAIAWAEVA